MSGQHNVYLSGFLVEAVVGSYPQFHTPLEAQASSIMFLSCASYACATASLDTPIFNVDSGSTALPCCTRHAAMLADGLCRMLLCMVIHLRL